MFSDIHTTTKTLLPTSLACKPPVDFEQQNNNKIQFTCPSSLIWKCNTKWKSFELGKFQIKLADWHMGDPCMWSPLDWEFGLYIHWAGGTCTCVRLKTFFWPVLVPGLILALGIGINTGLQHVCVCGECVVCVCLYECKFYNVHHSTPTSMQQLSVCCAWPLDSPPVRSVILVSFLFPFLSLISCSRRSFIHSFWSIFVTFISKQQNWKHYKNCRKPGNDVVAKNLWI